MIDIFHSVLLLLSLHTLCPLHLDVVIERPPSPTLSFAAPSLASVRSRILYNSLPSRCSERLVDLSALPSFRRMPNLTVMSFLPMRLYKARVPLELFSTWSIAGSAIRSCPDFFSSVTSPSLPYFGLLHEKLPPEVTFSPVLPSHFRFLL